MQKGVRHRGGENLGALTEWQTGSGLRERPSREQSCVAERTIVSTKDPGGSLENRRAELTELPVGKSSG